MSVLRATLYILLLFLALPSVGRCGWEDPVQLDSAGAAYPALSYSPDGELRVFYNNYQTNKMVVRKRAQGQTTFGPEVILYNDARAVGVHYAGGSTIDLAIANCDTATILKSTDNGDSGWRKNAASTDNADSDLDGDGLVDVTVYHEESGYWHMLLSGRSYSLSFLKFGGPGYAPVNVVR